jgi:hypothetical protein
MAGERGFARAPSREELERATLAELHELAAEREIPRYRTMRREVLVEAISGDELAEEADEEFEPAPQAVEEEPADAPPATEEVRAPEAAPKVNTEVFDSFDEAIEGLRDAIGERVQVVVSDADSEPEHWLEVSGDLSEERESEGRAAFAVGASARFVLDAAQFVSGERWTVDTGDYWRITIEQGRLRLAISDLR